MLCRYSHEQNATHPNVLRVYKHDRLDLSLEIYRNDQLKWYNFIGVKTPKGAGYIYRQELLQDISLLTSQPKARFFDELFLHLDLSFMESVHAKARRESQKEALLCAAIVMKREGFGCVTGLSIFELTNVFL